MESQCHGDLLSTVMRLTHIGISSSLPAGYFSFFSLNYYLFHFLSEFYPSVIYVYTWRYFIDYTMEAFCKKLFVQIKIWKIEIKTVTMRLNIFVWIAFIIITWYTIYYNVISYYAYDCNTLKCYNFWWIIIGQNKVKCYWEYILSEMVFSLIGSCNCVSIILIAGMKEVKHESVLYSSARLIFPNTVS